MNAPDGTMNCPNEDKSNERPAKYKDGWECSNIYATKRLLKIKTNKMVFRISHHFVSGSCEKIVRALRTYLESSLEELGTMSKNNLRGISLG